MPRVVLLKPSENHTHDNDIVSDQGQGLSSSGKTDTKLDSNCLYVMTPGCQEEYHHSVPEPKQKEDFLIHPHTGEIRLSLTFRHNKWGVKDVPKCKCGEPMNLHYFHGHAHGHAHPQSVSVGKIGGEGKGYFFRCNWTCPKIEKPCYMKVPFSDLRRGKEKRGKEKGRRGIYI